MGVAGVFFLQTVGKFFFFLCFYCACLAVLHLRMEVVNDSGIGMVADRLGRTDRYSDHPAYLPWYPNHARGRSAFPRRIFFGNGRGTEATHGQGKEGQSSSESAGCHFGSDVTDHRRLGGVSGLERGTTLNCGVDRSTSNRTFAAAGAPPPTSHLAFAAAGAPP